MRPGFFSPKGIGVSVALGFLSVGLGRMVPNLLLRFLLLVPLGIMLWALADWATPDKGRTHGTE